MKKIVLMVFAIHFLATRACQKESQVITLQNQFLKVQAKTKGAELISIQLLKDRTEYLWQGDSITWSDHAIVQFPIIGNLKEGRYTYDGKTYEMMSHGFARVSDFELVEQSEVKAVFELKSTAKTKELYPFDFTFQISYTLENQSIKVAYRLYNADDKALYFSLGYHPGFNCPLQEGEKMEDYYLVFSQTETTDRLMMDDNLMDTVHHNYLQEQDTLPLQKELFQDDAIILKDIASTSVSLRNKRNDKSVTLTFGDIPYLGIWSPKKLGNFVCIEPWLGIPDAKNSSGIFKEKQGIISLAEEEEFQWECIITIN